jgi:hypothetical protein
MPITEKEKTQLQTIIEKMDGMELVRFGGMIYDGLIALKNHIGVQKTIVLGKYISANVFNISADEMVQTEATPAAAPPPATIAAEPQANDPTTLMESVPGGDTELPPTNAQAEPATNGAKEASGEVTTADAADELDMLGDDEEDPLAGIDEDGDEEEAEAPDQEAAASTESPPAAEPVPPTEPAPTEPAETTT